MTATAKKSFRDTVSSILMKEGTENSATLKPGSKEKESMHVLPKGKVPEIEDQEVIVPDRTPVPSSGTMNGGPKITTLAKKDTSKSSQKQPGEAMHKLETERGKQPQSQTSPGVKASGEPGAPPQKISGTPIKPIKEDDDLPDTIDLEALIEQLVDEGLSEEEINATIDAILEDYEPLDEDEEVVSEETEEEEIKAQVPEIEINVDDDIKAMFEGQTFSEEFQDKAKLIYTASIKAKLDNYQAQLDEAFAAALVEATEDISKTLSENMEDYLTYAVDQWAADNEVALQSNLRTEWTEDFLVGLRNLMIENYVDIPEEKVDVVEELAAKVADLEAKLNEEIETNVLLTKTLSEASKWEAFAKATDGLAATQVEKLKGLVENVDFISEDDFAAKVKTLKESYFPSTAKPNATLEKEIVTDDEKKILSEDTNSPMNKYVKTLGRTLHKV